MKAERIDSSLHARIWPINRRPEAAARQIVFLSDGSGEAEAGGGRLAIAGPAVVWLGAMKPGRLRTEAGATGFRGWAGGAMLAAAIGDQAESAELARLADRDFVLSLAGHPAQAAAIERCFNAILAELAAPQVATPLLVSALLRVILASMLRVAAGGALPAPAAGAQASLLQRFRQLVELNFRDHWKVARYAAELGVSPDRLHAICTAATGRPPKTLISERLAHEAALRLERSSLTIQQLGHSLGFNDPAHFSNFFRRMTGMSPAGRRRMGAAPAGGGAPAPGFADWP